MTFFNFGRSCKYEKQRSSFQNQCNYAPKIVIYVQFYKANMNIFSGQLNNDNLYNTYNYEDVCCTESIQLYKIKILI